MENKELITILIPSYNEEENISLIYGEIRKVMSDYNYEIIYIDDGSTDNTEKVLEDLALKDDKVKYIQFSRNFGKESAISAGLDIANGDGVITIDADLQHPVDLIPEFISKWKSGFDVVVGVREKNKGEGIIKKFGSFMFYRIMNVIGETKITPRATDFRLLDRKVVLAFRKFTEHDRMARGLIDWLGFKRDYVYFKANARMNGKVAYNNIKLFKLAFSSMIAHSLFPLKFAGYLGIVITLISGGVGFYLMIHKYILRSHFGYTGSAQLAILTIFLVGLVLVSLGLIALYIGNIKAEVANRPTYVVRKKRLK